MLSVGLITQSFAISGNCKKAFLDYQHCVKSTNLPRNSVIQADEMKQYFPQEMVSSLLSDKDYKLSKNSFVASIVDMGIIFKSKITGLSREFSNVQVREKCLSIYATDCEKYNCTSKVP